MKGELSAAVRTDKQKKFNQHLPQVGIEEPYSGGKHEFMVRDKATVRIPNPHRGDIGVALLARILRQAGVSRDEWEQI